MSSEINPDSASTIFICGIASSDHKYLFAMESILLLVSGPFFHVEDGKT